MAPKQRSNLLPAAGPLKCGAHRFPLPPLEIAPLAKLSLLHSETEAYQTACLGEPPVEGHEVLGWPACGAIQGIPGAREQLLLSVRSEVNCGFNFGDASSIFFCISTTALAKADLTKAFCVNDE